MSQYYTVKLYDCKVCEKTMLLEIFADEKTALDMMKQNPYCDECISKPAISENMVRDDNTINARALFEQLIEATTMTRPDLEASIKAKVKELADLRKIAKYDDEMNLKLIN